jgi:hypothetical protein
MDKRLSLVVEAEIRPGKIHRPATRSWGSFGGERTVTTNSPVLYFITDASANIDFSVPFLRTQDGCGDRTVG